MGEGQLPTEHPLSATLAGCPVVQSTDDPAWEGLHPTAQLSLQRPMTRPRWSPVPLAAPLGPEVPRTLCVGFISCSNSAQKSRQLLCVLPRLLCNQGCGKDIKANAASQVQELLCLRFWGHQPPDNRKAPHPEALPRFPSGFAQRPPQGSRATRSAPNPIRFLHNGGSKLLIGS